MRKILLFVLLFNILFAETAIEQYDDKNNKIFELFADNVNSIDYTTIIATGNAVIVSQNIYVIADYIKYDINKREANISGNVKFYRDGSLFSRTQKAFVRFDDNYSAIEPFYIQDTKSGVWISASFAENIDNEYELKDVIMSGCDIDSPIWHIEGTSGSYNKDSYIASVWNPRIYIKNILRYI